MDQNGKPIKNFDIYDELSIGELYQGWDVIMNDKLNDGDDSKSIVKLGFQDNMGQPSFLAAFKKQIQKNIADQMEAEIASQMQPSPQDRAEPRTRTPNSGIFERSQYIYTCHVNPGSHQILIYDQVDDKFWTRDFIVTIKE